MRRESRPPGVEAPNHAETSQAAAGDLGAAHALFGLALAVEATKLGDTSSSPVSAAAAMRWCFEVTAPPPRPRGASEALRRGTVLKDYIRFL